MRLVDYLDKGRQLGADAPFLTMDGRDLSYDEVQRLTYRIARGFQRAGDGTQKRGLAGSIGADNGDRLAFAVAALLQRPAKRPQVVGVLLFLPAPLLIEREAFFQQVAANLPPRVRSALISRRMDMLECLLRYQGKRGEDVIHARWLS